MVAEEQKYISGIYRNIAFSFLAPIGAVAFQYLVFGKYHYVWLYQPLVEGCLLGYFFDSGIIMSRRTKMSEADIGGLIAVLGIVIPAFLFAAYVSYDQKKRHKKS